MSESHTDIWSQFETAARENKTGLFDELLQALSGKLLPPGNLEAFIAQAIKIGAKPYQLATLAAMELGSPKAFEICLSHLSTPDHHKWSTLMTKLMGNPGEDRPTPAKEQPDFARKLFQAMGRVPTHFDWVHLADKVIKYNNLYYWRYFGENLPLLQLTDDDWRRIFLHAHPNPELREAVLATYLDHKAQLTPPAIKG